jgi:hypothetical protein
MRHRNSLPLLTVCVAAWALVQQGCGGAEGTTGSQGPTGPTGPTGSSGPAGDAGPPGPGGVVNPSVSAVIPPLAFLSRTIDVTISGFGTTWTSQTTVDFGTNITVNSVSVASPTALVANITVADNATLGTRDVTVTEGTSALKYQGAFRVQSPIKVAPSGPFLQGSVVLSTVNQLDFSSPFDATAVGNFLTGYTYPNVNPAAMDGLTLSVNPVEPFAATLLALTDVKAAAGKKMLDLVSGTGTALTHNPNPDAIDVQARAPEPLAPNTPLNATVQNAYDSHLYSVTPDPGGAKVFQITVKAWSEANNPMFILLPPSGSYKDLISFATGTLHATDKTDPFFVVYWDNTGAFGYDYTVEALQIDVTGVHDTSNNTSAAQAVVIPSLPAAVLDGDFVVPSHHSWFQFTAAAGDIGKQVHVSTVGDSATDTVVDILGADGTTSMGGPSSDQQFYEDLLSTPIAAAGTIYVKVYPSSSSSYDPKHHTWQAVIRLK